jgi:hypothetical protein
VWLSTEVHFLHIIPLQNIVTTYERICERSADYMLTHGPAPQCAYDIFDKAIVLYQRRQIFFGRTTETGAYFEDMGSQCPDR